MIHRQAPVKQPDRPELFGELVAIVPEMARYVFGLAEKLFVNCESAVNLVGYDAAQGRMRQVLFLSEEGFSPRENTDRFVLMGDATAADLAGEMFISLNGDELDPPVTSIIPNLEKALSVAAQKCTTINGNLRSVLILPPETPNLHPSAERAETVSSGTPALVKEEEERV